MTNPIKLLRDFLKWRKERYNEEVACVVSAIADEQYDAKERPGENTAFYRGVLYGLAHRKEILKQAKICG